MNLYRTFSLTCAAFLCALLPLLPANAQAAPEFRALSVDAWGEGFLDAGQVTTLVDHCRTYNFNAVIVQMRRRGDAFYFPQAPNRDPRTTAVASNYDALQELINQCHTGSPRIEVHCWVVANRIWSNESTPPTQPGHVYNLHPEYLMKNSSGATFFTEGYYLDPGHPQAMLWLYNVAKDIVSRYDIDGFRWDYLRYPQRDSGYNATAIARYNEEFGLTGQPSFTNEQFSNWRRRQITDFVRWTTGDLLEIKPDIVISSSVFADRSDAYTHRYQDWKVWNEEGLIDLCMPMNYTSNNSTFNSRTDDAFNNQGVRRVYMGQAAYLNTKENTLTQLLYARNKLPGTFYYSYRVPNSGQVDRVAAFTHVRDNYQPVWENTPSLPWKTAPTKGIVKGTITRSDTGAPLYNAVVWINMSPPRSQKTDPHGKFAFFEVNPGAYTVLAAAPGIGNDSATVTVTAGGIVNVNLAAQIPAPTLNFSVSDGQITFTWEGNFILQSATEVAGTWSDVTGTSGHQEPLNSSTTRFFGLRLP